MKEKDLENLMKDVLVLRESIELLYRRVEKMQTPEPVRQKKEKKEAELRRRAKYRQKLLKG